MPVRVVPPIWRYHPFLRSEMPLPAKVRLLRVLQHREIERVGGTGRIPVDIRIIANFWMNLQLRWDCFTLSCRERTHERRDVAWT